jgi:hypothetical protein
MKCALLFATSASVLGIGATVENQRRARGMAALRATLGRKIKIAAQRNHFQFTFVAAHGRGHQYGAS